MLQNLFLSRSSRFSGINAPRIVASLWPICRAPKKLVVPIFAGFLIAFMEEKTVRGLFSLTLSLLQEFLPVSPGGGRGRPRARRPADGLGKQSVLLLASFSRAVKEMFNRVDPRGHSYRKYPVSVPCLEAYQKQRVDPFILHIP